MHQKLLFLMHFRFLYLNLSILKIQRNSLLLKFFFSSALSGFLTISVTTVAHRTFETLGIVHKSRHARWGRGRERILKLKKVRGNHRQDTKRLTFVRSYYI